LEARRISPAFRNAIMDNIVMHQTKDFVRTYCKTIDQLMSHYLYYGINKPIDIHEALLVRLKKMHKFLRRELETTNSEAQIRCLHSLCRGQVRIVGLAKIKKLLWAKKTSGRDRLRAVNTSEIGLQTKLAAAMSVLALLYYMKCWNS
jgi:hypothetical protein